jgi:hypothetical protein
MTSLVVGDTLVAVVVEGTVIVGLLDHPCNKAFHLLLFEFNYKQRYYYPLIIKKCMTAIQI